jgi:hypothetical protein
MVSTVWYWFLALLAVLALGAIAMMIVAIVIMWRINHRTKPTCFSSSSSTCKCRSTCSSSPQAS